MVKGLCLFLISLSAFALPPIDGGKDAPIASFDYVDIIKITRADQGECTATRVSPTLILTAAHCVKGINPGSGLGGVGKVVKVSVHPKYADAKLAKKKHLTTLYDIAFIELEARPSKRQMPYPTIISKSTKLGSRKEMELVGYGMNQARWNGSAFEYVSTKSNLQVADNNWDECPLDYFGNEVSALAKFNQNVKEQLAIKAKRVHTITNGIETIAGDGKGMVLPGDSGSPSIERDENQKFVITGVASNVVNFQDGSGQASFEIEVDGKVVGSKKLTSMPENWGQRSKLDSQFDDIKKILQEKNLLTETGEIKPGVVVKRQYTRMTDGNYADLSHPENQSFIKSIMPK